MTKFDILKKMGIEMETFDYALPQEWINEVSKRTGEQNIASHFVWLYDDRARIFGRPCSLTFKGNVILSKILMDKSLHLGAKYFHYNKKEGEINE